MFVNYQTKSYDTTHAFSLFPVPDVLVLIARINCAIVILRQWRGAIVCLKIMLPLQLPVENYAERVGIYLWILVQFIIISLVNGLRMSKKAGTYFDDETLNMFKDNHFAFPFSAQQLSTLEMM